MSDSIGLGFCCCWPLNPARALYAVENYVRPPDGKIGDGQCLSYAVMDKLNYDNYRYYDGEVDIDSDDSDYSTDSSDGEEDVDVLVVKQKTKYS